MIRGIFFDLDYTLYDLRQYLFGAFQDVAGVIAQEGGREAPWLAASLLDVWKRVGTGYAYLFNEWLQSVGLFTEDRVWQCVETFHAHRPEQLLLYAGAREALEELRKTYRLGLVTDGHVAMQRAKINALDLEKAFDVIVLAKEHAPSKPDPRIFRYASQALGVDAAECVFVGDHPVKDIRGARHVGMRGVRMHRGEFRSLADDEQFPPDHRITAFEQLMAWLQKQPAGYTNPATHPEH